MKKPRKTHYCVHDWNCDREEDCFNGEVCPFFESRFNSLEETIINWEDVAKDEFDKIWEDI